MSQQTTDYQRNSGSHVPRLLSHYSAKQTVVLLLLHFNLQKMVHEGCEN